MLNYYIYKLGIICFRITINRFDKHRSVFYLNNSCLKDRTGFFCLCRWFGLATESGYKKNETKAYYK